MGIVVGIAMVLTGFLMNWKTEWIINNFGTLPWPEEHLGSSGGTRIFYKLLGVFLIILGFMTMTGLLGNIGRAFLPRYFRSLTL